MKDNFENLDGLSIEELERTIEKAQALVQEKQQEAQYQAELERQRRERLEAERKKQEEMVACPQCHKLLPADSRFCFYCGSSLERKTEQDGGAVCRYCSQAIPVGSQFCPNCGRKVKIAEQSPVVPQNTHPTPQSAPQPSQSAPQPLFQSAPQSEFRSAPQPASQPSQSAPQPSFQSAPQPSFQSAPQPSQSAPQPSQSAPQPSFQLAPQPTRSDLPMDEDAFRKYVSPQFLYIFIGICVLTVFLWFSMSSDALFVFLGMMVIFGIPYLLGRNRISRSIAKMRSNGTYEPVLREFVSASSALGDKVRYSENYIFQKGSIKFYAYQDICWIYRFVRRFLFVPYISSAMVGNRTGIVAPFCSLKIGNQAGMEELQTLAALIRAKNPGLLMGFDPATQKEYHSKYPISKR